MSKASVAPRPRPSKDLPQRPQPKPHGDAQAAMSELAMLAFEVGRVSDAIELHRSALVGALAEIQRFEVGADPEGVAAFTDPILISLQDVRIHVENLAGRLAGVGRRLYRTVPCREAAK